MMNEKEKLLDHEYDGIHELDNPLPRWWLLTFYGAIVFSVFYVYHFHIGSGLSPRQELNADLNGYQLARNSIQKDEAIDPKKLLAVFNDKERQGEGKAIFKERCLSCHGASGEGSIGPNLTDQYWIHGEGELADIAKTVKDGVPDKGMPPWGAMLKDEEIFSVVAFVRSLRGTHPANPKAPQGNEIKK